MALGGQGRDVCKLSEANWNLLGSPVVKLHLSMQGVWFSSRSGS